ANAHVRPFAVNKATVFTADDATGLGRRRDDQRPQGTGHSQGRLPDTAEEPAPRRADASGEPFRQPTDLLEHQGPPSGENGNRTAVLRHSVAILLRVPTFSTRAWCVGHRPGAPGGPRRREQTRPPGEATPSASAAPAAVTLGEHVHQV